MGVSFKMKALSRATTILSLIVVCTMYEAVAKTYVVTTTYDWGEGSLRAAITAVNKSGCPTSEIQFALTSEFDSHSKSWCIKLHKPLPVITVPVRINGFSQQGSHPNSNAINQENNAHIAVEICCADGKKTDAIGTDCPAAGLVFGCGSDGSSLKGLAINGFDRAVEIESNNVIVTGMFLGVGVDGITPKPNTVSLSIAPSASGTIVGGCKPKQRNLIAGNGQLTKVDNGLSSQPLGAITNLGRHTTVQGTTINLNRQGNAVLLPLATFGIVSIGNQGASFGGTVAPERVVIAGHTQANILCDATIDDTYDNLFVGTALDGKTPLGGGIGLKIINSLPYKGTVRKLTTPTHAVLNSIFSGHSETGIVLGEISSENAVNGTYLFNTFAGTDVTGGFPVPNALHGLCIENATNTTIDCCVLCHNTGNGLYQSNAATGTILSNSNTSFNKSIGVEVQPLVEQGAPTADEYTVQLNSVTAVSNGNFALSSEGITIEQC